MDKPTGLIYENGVLVKYTIYGRKRKNWKQDYRKRSRNKLKHVNHCELCGSTFNPTVHHKIPLSKKIDISRENLIKVCRECHDKIEKGEINMTEYKLIDKTNSKEFAKALEGYGLKIDIDNEEVTIKIPSGRRFYEEFVGHIKTDIKEAVIDDPTVENI